MDTSIPNLVEFDPKAVPYQYRVIKDIRKNFDYSKGVHEILLSGSVGSAKSLLLAHLAVTHCLNNNNARLCLARKAMPDLKDTIWSMIFEHIGDCLVEGVDYTYTVSPPKITFIASGSEIICRSWSDKRYKKLRSLPLSAAIVEELTENDNKEFEGFYKELFSRVGRLPHVKETFIACATNPDSPAHAAYEYFITSKNPLRHVYYSVTTDNPFLPPWYIENLKKTYTLQEARRMIYGEWIEIAADIIYYAFDQEMSIIPDYSPDSRYPIHLTYDFNIGAGKPMSCIFFQYIDSEFLFFDEIVIFSARTLDTLEEGVARGLINTRYRYIIMGDRGGKNSDTRYNRSDYDIIGKFLGAMDVEYEIDVPSRNPPVRKRHILVNGQLKNANGETHVKITERCETAIKGMRLARLKDGGQYIENDNDPFQHITTAMGYGIMRVLSNNEVGQRLTIGSAQ